MPLATDLGSFQRIDSFEFFQIRSLICSVTLSAGYVNCLFLCYKRVTESLRWFVKKLTKTSRAWWQRTTRNVVPRPCDQRGAHSLGLGEGDQTKSLSQAPWILVLRFFCLQSIQRLFMQTNTHHIFFLHFVRQSVTTVIL